MNYEEFQKFKESSDEEKIAHLTTPDSTPAVNLDQLAEDLGPMGLNVPKEMGGYVVRPGLSAYASALGAAGGALKKSGHIFGIPIDTLWNKTRNIGNYLGLTEPEVRTEDTLQAEETPWQPLQDKAADYFLNSAKTVMGLEKEMKTPLTDPYADAGASLMFGMGGAAVAHQMAKKTITSLAARQAMNKGQSLAIGGSTAMAGDYVINRTLEQLDPVIEASGMSDNAKMLIKASIGIGLGFASGLTFETKMAKMMGDPLFVAFVESVAKRGGSSIDILDEMRHRQPEEFTDLDNL
ncbi:MAG: hypothetical protein HN929_02000, partial [Chloroflexi bacterium]|nr:hypothetical protein [Chloroflexota bacterium]